MSILHHTAISVTNIEPVAHFFESVFDMRRGVSWKRPEQELEGLYLVDEKGVAIELIKPKNPLPSASDFTNLSELGMRHIAFRVESVDMTFQAALREKAIELWPPQDGISVRRIAFVQGPEGIVIELLEPHRETRYA